MGIGSTKLAGEGNGRLIDQFDEITKKILVESGIEDDELFIMFDDWTNKLTAKGSQEMSYEEFTTSLKVTPNCILKKMFWKCILSSSKKRLTFVQFFCITWMFLTPPDSLCGPFLHMIYDSSCSGKMSEDDLELFVADMKLFLDPNECCYKDESKRPPNLETEARDLATYDIHTRVLDSLKNSTDTNDGWTINHCVRWSTLNHQLFRKFLELKHHCQSILFGKLFWERLTAYRCKDDAKVSVGYMLVRLKELMHEKKGDVRKSAKLKKKSSSSSSKITPETESEREAEKKREAAKKINNRKLARNYTTGEGHSISFCDYDAVDDMIDGFSISKRDKDKMDDKAAKDIKKKEKSMKSRVSNGLRRLSVSLNIDFDKNRGERKKEIDKITKKKKSGMSQKVTSSMRRLSVTMGLRKET